MDCRLIELDLVGFHFGVLDGETRARADQHLAGCADCVRAYLAVKRACESDGGERPSDLAREKLRRAVAGQLRQRRRRWYVRGAAAAAIVVVALLGIAGWRASQPGPASPARAVDSALAAPENLNFL